MPAISLTDIFSHAGDLIAELKVKKKREDFIDWVAVPLSLTHCESYPLCIFWQEWNWILKMITPWMSWGTQTRLSLCSLAVPQRSLGTWQPWFTVCSFTLNTRKISNWEYVTNGLWERDTGAHCSLPYTTKAIFQAVYHLCITAPWLFILFYYSYLIDLIIPYNS